MLGKFAQKTSRPENFERQIRFCNITQIRLSKHWGQQAGRGENALNKLRYKRCSNYCNCVQICHYITYKCWCNCRPERKCFCTGGKMAQKTFVMLPALRGVWENRHSVIWPYSKRRNRKVHSVAKKNLGRKLYRGGRNKQAGDQWPCIPCIYTVRKVPENTAFFETLGSMWPFRPLELFDPSTRWACNINLSI